MSITRVEAARRALAVALHLDPERVTFAPIATEMLGHVAPHVRVECVGDTDGMATIVFTTLAVEPLPLTEAEIAAEISE